MLNNVTCLWIFQKYLLSYRSNMQCLSFWIQSCIYIYMRERKKNGEGKKIRKMLERTGKLVEASPHLEVMWPEVFWQIAV